LRLVGTHKKVGEKVRTHARRARRVFLDYIKLRRARRTKTRAVHGRMIRFVRRNLAQARKLFERSLAGAQKLTRAQERTVRMLDTIGRLLEQQRELHRKTPRSGDKRGIRIVGRIVSIFREYVRPIPRGKIPVATEFGAKVLLEMRSGFVNVLMISFDNLADSEMIRGFFSRWKGLILAGDRGFHSKENTALAREHGLRGYHVERKGKRSLPKTRPVKRARCARAAIEAKISLAKRKFGLDRVRYGRGEEGERQWILLGLTAMNFDRALKLTAA
jgi:hypothetical protein